MVRLSPGMAFALILFGLCATYVYVINTVAIRGTQIRTLERRVAALTQEVEAKEIHEARLRSLTQLTQDDATMEAIAQGEVRTIALTQAAPHTVARAHTTLLAAAQH